MIHVPFDEIDKDVIEKLVTDQVAEGKTLEYKLTLPRGSNEDKREFLADVSSFANAAGGHIVYGVEEDTDEGGKNNGRPKAAHGIEELNADAEILRLESTIRSAIEPRIPGVQLKAIDGFPRGPVLVVRIPKSWASPHMVTFKNWSRFFSRTSAGKQQLDVGEIRAAFALSEELPRRIERFRNDRLAKIIADETAVPLVAGAKAIVHLIPISSLEGASAIDLTLLRQSAEEVLTPHYAGHHERINIDGLVRYLPGNGGRQCEAYTQFFRTGAIEGVGTRVLRLSSEQRQGIPGGVFVPHTIEALSQYLQFLRNCDVQPPAFLFMTLTGVKGWSVFGRNVWPEDWQDYLIDRDPLFVPEVLVEDLSEKPDHILREVFHAVWQAAGHTSCEYYDENGNWKGR